MRAIARVRNWFEEQTGARGIVVGVVVGLGLLQLFQALGRYVFLPFVQQFQADAVTWGRSLMFNVAGVDFALSDVVISLFTLVLLLAIVWVPFVHPLPSEERLAEDKRECPECKTDIWIDATRCPACRIPVAPLPRSQSAVSEQEGQV